MNEGRVQGDHRDIPQEYSTLRGVRHLKNPWAGKDWHTIYWTFVPSADTEEATVEPRGHCTVGAGSCLSRPIRRMHAKRGSTHPPKWQHGRVGTLGARESMQRWRCNWGLRMEGWSLRESNLEWMPDCVASGYMAWYSSGWQDVCQSSLLNQFNLNFTFLDFPVQPKVALFSVESISEKDKHIGR